MSGVHRDRFEQEYAAGVLRADPAPDLGELRARAAPARSFALSGCVCSSTGARAGHIVIAGDTIADVTSVAPEGIDVIDTGGVILPGLIDLHGHPEYNVFAPWEPPATYANRGAWRTSPEYATLVKAPWATLKRGGLVPTLTRYAEIRALVGGVTALQGSAVAPNVLQESLVRNVDRRIFGEHLGRSIIDLGSVDEDDLRSLKAGLADGSITAVYVHLAEGVDDESRDEFELLKRIGLLVEQTVIIHGTALTDAQLGEVADAAAKLVWSPQSNLRLYAATTHAATAAQLGIPVGLGADWVPSGSLSTLDELRVARHQLAAQGAGDDPRALVGMVTWAAAAIAGLSDHIGDLRAGMAADVVVLERGHDDPWESVLHSEPSDVELVIIGGNVVYARSDWYAQLTGNGSAEPLWAWGRPMTLDTSYSVRPDDTPPPRLADLRRAILGAYLGAGPIFA